MARNKDESGNCQDSPPVIENIVAGAEQESPDDETLLDELAALPRIEYERRREAAADQLRIRVTILDGEVQLRRKVPEDAGGQGHAIKLTVPEPWHEAVDGADLLDKIIIMVNQYLSSPKGAAEAMALWVLHTHAFEAAEFAPRLSFISPLPECGKTTALSLIARMVPRPLPTSNVSTAVVFRVIEAAKPTLVIDEGDTFIKDNNDLRGVLNSGHARDMAYVIRSVSDDHKPRQFSTWAPMAIAVIGKLPATLRSRSIEIPMQRRPPNRRLKRLRRNRYDELGKIASMAARWAADNLNQLIGNEPDIVEKLNDRANNNWEPLFAIADQVGGEWPERARNTAITLSGNIEEMLPRALLLADIKVIFDESGADRLPSQTICDRLAAMEDRPWPEWGRSNKAITTNALARLLKDFKISPGSVRTGPGNTPKGYKRADFKEAFASYLSDPPSQTATPPQVKEGAGYSDFQTATELPDVAVA
ncbi:MAG: DUF3631 domain-containing protein, partial [Alphaproteobacteria bacterium]|nr:DUF3631 domain-containing protein [Alphaproteobacteria bacterium]